MKLTLVRNQADWFRQSLSGRILSAAATIAGTSGIVKLAGLGKEILVARYFGASEQLDAFYVALLLPTYLIGTVSAFSYDALVPTYIEVRARQGDRAAKEVFANTAAVTIFALLVLVLALGSLQQWFLPLLGSGFESNKLALTRRLFLILLILLALGGLNTLWRAVLNARERYALTAGSPIAIPLAIAVMLVVRASAWGIYALALGTLVGVGLELSVNGYSLRKLGLPLLPRWRGLDAPLQEILRQAIPALAGSLILGSSTIVDQSMAATLDSGSVSILNYGNKLVTVLLAITTSSLWGAMLPALSRLTADRDWKGMRTVLSSYTRLILLSSIPATAILIVLSKPIIALAFHRGSFSMADVELASRVQSMLCLGLPFNCLAILYVSGLCALKRNYVLMWGTGICVVENVGLDYILMKLFAVPGIALSTSLVYATSCIYLRAMLYRALREKEMDSSLLAEAQPHAAVSDIGS